MRRIHKAISCLVNVLWFFGCFYLMYCFIPFNVTGPIFDVTRNYSNFEAFQHKNPFNCSQHIQKSKKYLLNENISYSCEALEEEGCDEVYNYYLQMDDPLSVFLRSSSCDIDWPQFKSISPDELNFPLAYFITAFTDSRNLELTLATIFRPHNSYCIHIDLDSETDPIFTRAVQQILNCYRM